MFILKDCVSLTDSKHRFSEEIKLGLVWSTHFWSKTFLQYFNLE